MVGIIYIESDKRHATKHVKKLKPFKLIEKFDLIFNRLTSAGRLLAKLPHPIRTR